MITEELERAIDDTLPSGCGGCGRSLPRPGLQCPQCHAWPDITREEQAALLSVPGELTLHRADLAESRALDLLQAFTAASAVPDRLRKHAEIERTQAEVQEMLAFVAGEHAAASGRLTAALEAEAEPKRLLDEALEVYQAARAALEAAERTMAGPRAEVEAGVAIARAEPVLEKYRRLYDQAAAVTASARLDVEQADLMISLAEQARDEQAARLLHIEEVRPSAERLALMAHPLVRYAAELAADQQSESPQFPDEWANLLGVVYALAGSTGLLAQAEEGAMPRILQDLTGPLSRAEDVVTMQRRTVVSHLALPPGPGEASMATLGNKLY